MATSGTRNFKLDVSELIEEAYERIGREARTAYDAQKARRSLNIMFQDWSNKGINLWTVTQVTTPLVAGQADYPGETFDVDVLEAVLRRGSTDYQMERITRQDYLFIPNKSTQGRPTQLYIERTTPLVAKVWPVPENATDVLVSYRIQQIQDANTSQNDIDVPARFIPAMTSGLAYFLAMKLEVERAPMMKAIYEEDFMRAANEDSERGSLYIVPGNR